MYMNRKQIMKDMKNKKRDKLIKEEENYVNRFVFAIFSILVTLIIGYLMIGIFVNKTITFNKDKDKKEEIVIDNSTILAGEIFDQSESEYYVLIYDKSDEKNILSNWKSAYESKDNALKVYVVDSSKKLNSNFLVEKESNTNPTGYNDLKIKSPTLIKISNKNEREFYKKYVGLTLEGVTELRKDGTTLVHTSNFIPVLVKGKIENNKIVTVKINKIEEDNQVSGQII